MSKSYSLILNSANTKNLIDNSSIGAYRYYVNWRAMLPQNGKRFNVSWSIRSAPTGTVLTNIVLLSVNLGNCNVYDQTGSQTSIIGAIAPKSYVSGSTQYYYESMMMDAFSCSFPSNDYITVNMLTTGYTTTTTLGAYVLQLSFTEIDD